MLATDDAHALVIGIANYLYAPKLRPAVTKDAQDLYELLVDRHVAHYPKRNVHLLLDAEANRVALRQALGRLAVDTSVESTVLIYFGGHAGRLMEGQYAGEYVL